MKKNNSNNDTIKNESINEEKIKKKKKKKLPKVILAILFILLITLIISGTITLIISGTWFGYKVYKNGGGMQGVLATIVGHDENTLKQLPKVYCLVTGQSQNLTDTIMVCSYDPKTQEASILSIPRDTFIGYNKRSADSYDKINSLYQIDPKKTLDAVNELTGLNIKYQLNVDTEALRELVDSIGGVYFNVPIDMDYEDSAQDLYIDIKKGYQLLDGDKAEQVVRFRHNSDGTSYPMEYGDNDLGRMRTQREFIQAVIKKLATPATLTKINDLIKIANKNVTTNIDLSLLKDYAPYAVDFKVENLKTGTLPGTPEMYNGMWFYAQNISETKTVIKELFDFPEDVEVDEEDDDDKISTLSYDTKTSNLSKVKISEEQKEKNSQIKIEILNGTSDSSKLNKIKTTLKEYGYNVTKTGITTSTSKTNIINRTGVQSSSIDSIKEIVGDIQTVLKGSDNSNVDITIIIGKDI